MDLLGVRLFSLFMVLSTLSGIQAKGSSNNTKKVAVEVRLEERRGQVWRGVDPHTVFRAGNEIRFRVRASLFGYLYVFNRSSDGEGTWIFPQPSTADSSRIKPGFWYVVPGTRGWYIVGGKPGFDVTYWILSPSSIDIREELSPTPGDQPNTLIPRCRSDALRSRGLCLDTHAGPATLELPQAFKVAIHVGPTLAPRELKFETDENLTRISAQNVEQHAIVYEFRIAHN